MPLLTVCRFMSKITLLDVVKVGVMVICVSSAVAEFIAWIRLP